MGDREGRNPGDPGYDITTDRAAAAASVGRQDDPVYSKQLEFEAGIRKKYGNAVADLVIKRFRAASEEGSGQQRAAAVMAAFERVPEFIQDALAKDKSDRWHEFIQVFEETKIKPFEGTPEGAEAVKGIRALLYGTKGLLETYERWYQGQDHASQSAADAHTGGIETFLRLSPRDLYLEGNPGAEPDDPRLASYASLTDVATKILSDVRKRQQSLIDEYQRGVEKLRATLGKTIGMMPESDARMRLEEMRQGLGDKFVLDRFLDLDGKMNATEFLNGWYAIDMHSALTGTAYQAGLEEGNVLGSVERVGQEQKRMDFQEAYDITLEQMTPDQRAMVRVSADDLWNRAGMDQKNAAMLLRGVVKDVAAQEKQAKEQAKAKQTQAGLQVQLGDLTQQGVLPEGASQQQYIDYAIAEGKRTGETPSAVLNRILVEPLKKKIAVAQQKGQVIDAQGNVVQQPQGAQQMKDAQHQSLMGSLGIDPQSPYSAAYYQVTDPTAQAYIAHHASPLLQTAFGTPEATKAAFERARAVQPGAFQTGIEQEVRAAQQKQVEQSRLAATYGLTLQDVAQRQADFAAGKREQFLTPEESAAFEERRADREKAAQAAAQAAAQPAPGAGQRQARTLRV